MAKIPALARVAEASSEVETLLRPRTRIAPGEGYRSGARAKAAGLQVRCRTFCKSKRHAPTPRKRRSENRRRGFASTHGLAAWRLPTRAARARSGPVDVLPGLSDGLQRLWQDRQRDSRLKKAREGQLRRPQPTATPFTTNVTPWGRRSKLSTTLCPTISSSLRFPPRCPHLGRGQSCSRLLSSLHGGRTNTHAGAL